MSLTFIDTNALPKAHTSQGDVTEILNGALAGAENAKVMLRWLKDGEALEAGNATDHQLLYLMEGDARITLGGKGYDVKKGGGLYLGPKESAQIAGLKGGVKLLHLVTFGH